MNRFYRYVTPSCVQAYEALGWLDLGPTPGHHGQWSNTMVYADHCEEPPEPVGPITAVASEDVSHLEWDESASLATRAGKAGASHKGRTGKASEE